MSLFRAGRGFAGSLWSLRRTIWELARRDFINQHSGTILGVFWNYVQPLTYALLVSIVFSLGLRHNPGRDVPYLPFLISGMMAWLFFSTALGSLSGSIRAYSFLVRKGNFNLAILPLGKLFSLMAPHLGMIVAVQIICWLNGFPPSLYSLQVFYYLAAMSCLLLGLGWITSSTSLFIEDIQNVVGVIIQFGFWFTPIIWNIRLIPPSYRWIINLNPAYYFVNGYRNCFVYRVPFWERPHVALYYWLFTLTVLIVGAVIFRRLKPHFGEVL